MVSQYYRDKHHTLSLTQQTVSHRTLRTSRPVNRGELKTIQ